MNIIFDSEKKIFHLKTAKSSYIIYLTDSNMLLHLYYGKLLEDTDGVEKAVSVYEENGGFTAFDYDGITENGKISTDVIPREYSFYGSADLRKATFHAQYENGSRITKMKYVNHRIFASKPKLNGLPATYTENDNEASTLEIEMKDEVTGLILVYRYTAFTELDVITRSITAKNEGNEKINIKAILSCCVDFYDNDFDIIHLWGSWGKERRIERMPLAHGTIQIESRRGSSSSHHSPFFALARKNTTEEHGEVYGFSLVYSGNFEAGAEVYHLDRVRAYIGINSFDFNWLLEPGEEFSAPEAVMVYSSDGLGEMSRTYHKLYRTYLARGKYKNKERPILINNWEGTFFDFNEEKLLEIAKTAKKAGIELFVLDDGWFGKRNIDNCSLGDWYVNKNKLPNGIEGLARRINAEGMKFGLWFEPEMISPDSDLYRQHPDWCLQIEDREKSYGRNQLILDLSRDDVCNYIIKFMSEYLETGLISYVKWDMNRNMTEVGSVMLPAERQQEVAHRYILGLYRVLETITQKYPDVLFEGCSGGGGRFDAGVMHYFDQHWTSDNTDAIERLYIQHGTSMVMPTIFMGAHVSAVPNHQTGRSTNLKIRGDVAMCGQFGYELDITMLNEEELKEVSEQVKKYKEIREVIHKGDMYRLKSPFEDNETAWEYVSEDKNTVILALFRHRYIPAMKSKRIRFTGLLKEAKYKNRENGDIYSGDVLMNCGIIMKELLEYESDMVIFDKVN